MVRYENASVTTLTSVLNQPRGVAIGLDGALYVSETFRNRIVRVDRQGAITTVAGDGGQGFSDGPARSARFYEPRGVAFGSDGTLYVADYGNNSIRMISPAGQVSTLAGNGTRGYVDGNAGRAGDAEFTNPSGVAVDGDAVIVADEGNGRIRKIVGGVVTTIAGNGNQTSEDGTGGPNGSAAIHDPWGITIGPDGMIFLTETLENRVRMINVEGLVGTLSGNGSYGYIDGSGGRSGSSTFDYPIGLARDGSGMLFVADTLNHAIRAIDRQGNTTTVAGTGVQGDVDGSAGPTGTAQFDGPVAVAVAPDGVIYVVERAGFIRVITPPGSK